MVLQNSKTAWTNNTYRKNGQLKFMETVNKIQPRQT